MDLWIEYSTKNSSIVVVVNLAEGCALRQFITYLSSTKSTMDIQYKRFFLT